MRGLGAFRNIRGNDEYITYMSRSGTDKYLGVTLTWNMHLANTMRKGPMDY